MQYFLCLIGIPFLYFNYKIILSDLKFQKIPNKFLVYLLMLIPFFWAYLFISGEVINILLFILQMLLALAIGFLLYYFGVWAAGDAKYLTVLALFIPHIGIISFIGNIALLTICYLFIYFIWFWFGKVLLNKHYRKNLGGNIMTDLKDKWMIHKLNKGGNTLKIIIKFLFIFLIIFVSIRLIRIYFINSFLINGNKTTLISEFIQKYNLYLIFLLIIGLIIITNIFKILIKLIKKYTFKNHKINKTVIGNIFFIILTTLIISFITNELYYNRINIINSLSRIFSIYLLIYLVIKLIKYSYKITFGIEESILININKLKEGNVVDKKYLIKMFSDHNSIYIKNIKHINTYLTKQDLKQIHKSVFLINKYINNSKNKIIGEPLKEIKILKTFSFSPYIITGLLITIIFNNHLIVSIIDFIISIIYRSFLS